MPVWLSLFAYHVLSLPIIIHACKITRRSYHPWLPNSSTYPPILPPLATQPIHPTNLGYPTHPSYHSWLPNPSTHIPTHPNYTPTQLPTYSLSISYFTHPPLNPPIHPSIHPPTLTPTYLSIQIATY